MSKTIYLQVIFTLLITACGAQTPTESPPENYPAPQETEEVQVTEAPDTPEEPGYPPPYNTATPIGGAESAYPAPEEGMETFLIVPGESTVTYEVGEVFLNQDNAFNLAVGVTSEVNGEIIVDRNNPQNSTIDIVRVDVSKFESDNQRRDNAIRERFLESSLFPVVEFTPSEIQGLPESYEEGQTITFQVSGGRGSNRGHFSWHAKSVLDAAPQQHRSLPLALHRDRITAETVDCNSILSLTPPSAC